MMWPISGGQCIALVAALVSATANGADAPSYSALLVPQLHAENGGSIFHQPELGYQFGQDTLRAEFGMRWRAAGYNLVATERLRQSEGGDAEVTGIVNEFYWNGTVFGEYVTVGKKIMSWDVGFGFRPLDVLQRDDRRVLLASTYEGIPMFAWDRFGEESAFTLVYANPGAGRADAPRDDASLAAHYYRHVSRLDFHAIGRVSERLLVEAGLAATAVMEDDLEIHGSIRYQRRLERTMNRLAEDPVAFSVAPDPLVRVVEHDQIAALVGATWTSEGGTSVLGEWWYDPAAYTAVEWHRLFALARKQVALAPTGTIPTEAIAGSFAANLAYFQQPNLMRHNVLLRVSHRRDTFESSVDLLWTPEDSGLVATVSEGYGFNGHRLTIGARTFAGAETSVFRAVPDRHIVFCAWETAW